MLNPTLPSVDHFSGRSHVDTTSHAHEPYLTQSLPEVDTCDYTQTLQELIRAYKKRSRPVEVNFRKLVPLHSGIDRATHLFHSYPAKLLASIPFFFLRCRQLGSSGTLRDPFCGTGTVLLEGALRGWKISGADANPLARLITSAKLTYLGPEEITEASARVCELAQDLSGHFSPVVNVDLWFPKTVQQQLGALVTAIDLEEEPELRRFLQVCLSSVVRKVSLADPRLSVPVRAKRASKQWERAHMCSVTGLFLRATEENARRLQCLRFIDQSILNGLTISEDARGSPDERKLREDVDLVITSPPYVGAQKYIRASSLSIGWLALAPSNKLRPLERLNIGREHFSKSEYAEPHFSRDSIGCEELQQIWEVNPLRAHIAATYLSEMRAAIRQTVRRMRSGGRLVLISGNNTIVGKLFPTSGFLAALAEKEGLSLELELVDDIRSRGLMTKRNKTAGVITREHIHLFVKP